ncbi:MAG: PAS domain S-box protein [Euryarchaeota archaeon]|nr:PAS domain S-box protein [Euryarchaeota archaeon]
MAHIWNGASYVIYESIIRLSNEGIWSVDADGMTNIINERGAAILGYAPEELIGRPAIEFGFPTFDKESDAWRMNTPQEGRYDLRISRKDGSEAWLSLSYSSFFDSDGRYEGAVALFTEIAEDKGAEIEPKRAGAHLKAILDQMPVGVIIVEPPDGKIIYQNEEMGRIFRYGTRLTECLEGPDRWQMFDLNGEPIGPDEHVAMRSLRDGKVVKDPVVKIVRGDGIEEYAGLIAAPINDVDGNTTAVIAIHINFSEQTRLSLAGETSEELYRSVGEHIRFGMWAADPDGHLTYLSRPYRELIGRDMEEVQTTGIGDLIHPEDRERIINEWEIGLERGENWESIYRIMDTDGTYHHVLAQGVPVRDHAGKLIRWIGLNIDFSRQNMVRERLIRSNEELRLFAYVASHDLQEPLRMVSSFLSLLSKRYGEQLDERAQGYIQQAVSGAHRMRDFIDDLLAYSRVDSRPKMFTEVDMSKVVSRAIDLLRPSAIEENVEFVIRPLPIIHANESQVTQLMQNLISNAIKFRGPERPRVEIWATGSQDEWVFTVKDNGIGIDPSDHDRLFKMFQRLHSRGEYPGTGIGLNIARKIVEHHGGRIWVESEKGKGSAFFFTIPRARAT